MKLLAVSFSAILFYSNLLEYSNQIIVMIYSSVSSIDLVESRSYTRVLSKYTPLDQIYGTMLNKLRLTQKLGEHVVCQPLHYNWSSTCVSLLPYWVQKSIEHHRMTRTCLQCSSYKRWSITFLLSVVVTTTQK